MENPTQEGASIHDRLMDRLDPQPEPENKEEGEPEPIEDEESTQDIEEGEEQEDEGEEEPESSEEDEQPESEEQLSTEDLSNYLGLESDVFDFSEDGDVLVKTKVDGEEGTAKFKDILASYQMRKHLDNESREVKQREEALNQQMAELDRVAAERVQQLDSAIQLALSEIETDENSAEMQELRESDPAEWTARLRENENRKARLSEAYQLSQKERIQLSQSNVQKFMGRLAEENNKLVHAIEGWTDPQVAEKEFSDVTSYLQDDYGFTAQEIHGVPDNQGNIVVPGMTDHRQIVLARKAMLYDQLQNKNEVVQKKVRKAPKLVKPGQAPVKNPNNDLEKKKKAIKSGKTGSVADFLQAKWKTR